MRVKRGVPAHAKHKKVLKAAKGMQHNRTRSFRLAKQAVVRALQYAYRDRRNKKRDLRALWITRINAAARANGGSKITVTEIEGGQKVVHVPRYQLGAARRTKGFGQL